MCQLHCKGPWHSWTRSPEAKGETGFKLKRVPATSASAEASLGYGFIP